MITSVELFGTPTKRIMDPVHGSIPIFKHEQLIIDHPLFQRLRHILQNDVVFYVFPGAKHNRFLHSIGTMHMLSSIVTQTFAFSFTDNDIETITEGQRTSIKYLYSCLRMAALLHDTGHCPYAHQFEQAKAVKQLMNRSLFEKLWEGIPESQKYYTTTIESLSHEHLSVRVAYEILKSNTLFSEYLPEDILYFLDTTQIQPSDQLLEHANNIVNIYISRVHTQRDKSVEISFLKVFKSFISGELDADKMDYILRDSYFSGCRYGMYNKDHLLNSLSFEFTTFPKKISETEFTTGDIEFSLAIQEKGVGALQDFIFARYQLYLELYNHKTVSGIRLLLSLALSEVMEIESVREAVKSNLSNIQKFTDFTDTFFWEEFRKHSQSHPQSACGKLMRREKLEYFGMLKNVDEEKADRDSRRLSEEHGLPILYWKSHIKFSKINETFEAINVSIKSQNKVNLVQISSVTTFFSKFDKVDIYHLFKVPWLQANLG